MASWASVLWLRLVIGILRARAIADARRRPFTTTPKRAARDRASPGSISINLAGLHDLVVAQCGRTVSHLRAITPVSWPLTCASSVDSARNRSAPDDKRASRQHDGTGGDHRCGPLLSQPQLALSGELVNAADDARARARRAFACYASCRLAIWRSDAASALLHCARS
jgi:hypothetical protein